MGNTPTHPTHHTHTPTHNAITNCKMRVNLSSYETLTYKNNWPDTPQNFQRTTMRGTFCFVFVFVFVFFIYFVCLFFYAKFAYFGMKVTILARNIQFDILSDLHFGEPTHTHTHKFNFSLHWMTLFSKKFYTERLPPFRTPAGTSTSLS